MSEKYILANGIHLCYEEFGKKEDPAMILIMGLGTQMTAWPTAFCLRLAEHGYRIIRFDNRDVGLSDKIKVTRSINLLKVIAFAKLGLRFYSPYSLADMATDAVGILTALDIEKAHWVGASLGGMIAQQIAAYYPDHCLSLTSIMSTSGNPKLTQPSLGVMRTLMSTPNNNSQNAYLENVMAKWAVFGSPDYPPNKDELAERLLAAYRRNYYPQGFKNQLAAIAKSGDRSAMLKTITLPTLVIHGREDKLIPVDGGVDTATLINNSTLRIIEGMGHDLPKELLPKFARLISSHAQSVAEKERNVAA